MGHSMGHGTFMALTASIISKPLSPAAASWSASSCESRQAGTDCVTLQHSQRRARESGCVAC